MSAKWFSSTGHLEQEEGEASNHNGIFYYTCQAVERSWRDCALSYFGPNSQSVYHSRAKVSWGYEDVEMY